jgi:hypothetical protein
MKRKLTGSVLALVLAWCSAPGVAHEGHEHAVPAKKVRLDLGIGAAFDSEGRLWIVGKESAEGGAGGEYVTIKNSRDEGKTWSKPVRINPLAEAVVASGEDHPQLLIQSGGKLLVSWTRPGKKYAGDIRSAVSTDGGLHWSLPATVHHDSQLLAHRHASLASDRAGHVYAVWIDRRQVEGTQAQANYRGASLYYAVSDDGGEHWRGDYRLADHACDCCRLALQNGDEGAAGPLLFWRQLFENGVRDHALTRLQPDGKAADITRATFDEWKVDACPDHGPALALADGVRHAVWFTRKDQVSQLFYGRLQAGRVEGQLALPDGAEHPAIVAQGARVWLVWKYFDGQVSRIGAWTSTDGGKNWQKKNLAETKQGSDHPRLLLQGNGAVLLWHTRQDGLIVKRLEADA